jgi:plastocyanin
LNLRHCGPLLTGACAAALGLALAGCGSSSSTSSTSTAATTPPTVSQPSATTTAPATGGASGATTLSLAADPSGQLQYVQKSLTTKAGKVTIDFANQAPVPHDVAVAQGSNQLGVTPVFSGGGTKTLTLTLAKGTYTFYCTVDSHRQAGMTGTLTVN